MRYVLWVLRTIHAYQQMLEVSIPSSNHFVLFRLPEVESHMQLCRVMLLILTKLLCTALPEPTYSVLSFFRGASETYFDLLPFCWLTCPEGMYAWQLYKSRKPVK